MKNYSFKKTTILLTLLLASTMVFAQVSWAQKAFEFGLGASVTNQTRNAVSNLLVSDQGGYVFTFEEKMLYGGVNVYSALELKPWLYVDLQGVVSFVKHPEVDQKRRGTSLLVGPGFQFRPFVKSEWIQPYFRLGMNYFHKNFSTMYFGNISNGDDVDAAWTLEDAWNATRTQDANEYFPISVGIGIVGWMGERIGVRIQADYDHSLFGKGENFALASLGLVYRLNCGRK